MAMATATATTSMSANDSLAASPRSVRSNETFASSSASSHPRSSLLEQDDNSPRGGSGRRGSRSSNNNNNTNNISSSSNSGAPHHERVSSIDSGFTNPSSFGSMFALLNNPHSPQSRMQQPGQRPDQLTEDDGSALLPPNRQEGAGTAAEISAYSQGVALARRAWLEMDAEVEAMRSASDISIERNCDAVTKSNEAAIHLTECPTYACARCGTVLALQDELISKAFSGRDGKAFLFFTILNTKVGPKEDRQLLTGLHTVADLSCMTCQRSVGWCYLRAFEASQRYKEGKFILERAMLHKSNNWQLDS